MTASAKAVLFLIDRDFITGECILDGGRHLYSLDIDTSFSSGKHGGHKSADARLLDDEDCLKQSGLLACWQQFLVDV